MIDNEVRGMDIDVGRRGGKKATPTYGNLPQAGQDSERIPAQEMT